MGNKMTLKLEILLRTYLWMSNEYFNAKQVFFSKDSSGDKFLCLISSEVFKVKKREETHL